MPTKQMALRFLILMLGGFFAIHESSAQTSESIQLTPGFSRIIRFDRSVSTIIVGNPEVVDARAQTDRAIVLVGKVVGITNLIVLDEASREVLSTLVVVGTRDAGKVVIHARPKLHEYWAYRCTEDNCVRVQDKLEYLQSSTPMVVMPSPPPAPTN
jgi:Flp pilus assembly secretin CpaC